MNKSAIFFIGALCTLLLSSCGSGTKTTKKTPSAVTFPSVEECRALLEMGNPAIYFRQEAAGPAVYGIEPVKDSSGICVKTLYNVKRNWTKTFETTYPGTCNFPVVNTEDASDLTLPDGKRYLTGKITRQKGKTVAKEMFCYLPEDYSMTGIEFTGKIWRDGLVHGTTNIGYVNNPNEAKYQWCLEQLKKDSSLVFLSDARAKTELAIDVWMEKNDEGRASKLSFGQLPEDCSLIGQFQKEKKQSSKLFKAVIIDTEENTLIVAQNRTKAYCFLAWAEPRCLNSKTDQLLNAIDFSSASELVLYYYKGSKTYKRRLSLSSGSIR